MSWASEMAAAAAKFRSAWSGGAGATVKAVGGTKSQRLWNSVKASRAATEERLFKGVSDEGAEALRNIKRFGAPRGSMVRNQFKPNFSSLRAKGTPAVGPLEAKGSEMMNKLKSNGQRLGLKILGKDRYKKLFGAKGLFTENGAIGGSDVFKNAVSAGKNFGSGFADGFFSPGMTRSIGAGAVGGAIGGLGGAARSAYNGDMNGSDGWGFVKSVGQGAFLGGAVGLAHSGLTGLAKTQAVSSSAWQNVGKFAEKTTNWTNSKTMRGAVTVAAAMNGYGSMTSPVNKHHRVKR